MKEHIEERALQIAKYICNEKATIKQAADFFEVSESTVYKDMKERLPKINPLVASMIREVMDTNKTKGSIEEKK